MIARYDGKAGRWSAAGIVLSLLIGGAALTGGVSGQDAGAAPGTAPGTAVGTPKAATPQRFPAGYSEAIDSSAVPKVDPKVAEKLWSDKYAARIISIDGVEANRNAVDQAYLEELAQIAAGKTPEAPRPGGVDVARLDAGAAPRIWIRKYQDKLIYVNGKPVNRHKLEQEFVDEIAQRLGSREAAQEAVNGLLPWRAGAGDPDAVQELWETQYKPHLRNVDGKAINEEEVKAQFKADLKGLERRVRSEGHEGRAQAPAEGARPEVRAAEPFGAEAAAKLWETYAQKIYMVNGQFGNKNAVDQEYLAALKAAGGSDEAANRLLREVQARFKDKPESFPRPPEPPPQEREGGASAPVQDEDVDRAVLAQLERVVPEVNFDGVGLSDVVDFLRDVSGANIVVEWGHLAAAGVDKNAPVTLRLRGVKFGRILELVLSSAGGGAAPLGYSVQDNVIRLSTLEHLDMLTDVRAYDVRDIVPAEIQAGDLTRMIMQAVAPSSWGENGGSNGTIHASKHKLIVRQTPMNHRQVRDILRMLREDPTRVPQATDAASAAQGPAATPGRTAQRGR